MEKEGLSQALQFLHENALTAGMLITDRHKHINKFMNQDYSEVDRENNNAIFVHMQLRAACMKPKNFCCVDLHCQYPTDFN